MPATLERPRLRAVNDAAGANIQRRRLAMGLSVSKLAAEAKVDRGRLAALEAGDPKVRPSTIGAVESALERLETEMGMNAPSALDTDYVEFRIPELGDMVVRGPVRDLDALQKAVARLLREMRGDTPNEDD